ncbi:Ig-like domain-containing protein [Shewanella sp. FJAT-52076]|uniref:Ig-like domain-containing protein n=1 Tax=Shewanella sp. FJAT-52076 TaxID=2864202 RepID=UPI001C65F852|nr:Ig-like domain-containing protein [Shewanella sp. FJAT-52076]QYJ76449.1 thrombospondin type 3 repeat-containing protein [Shewanella sp. FJAT-52076]
MKRLLTMALIVGLCSSHSLFAASLTKQSVNFSGNAKDIGVVNDVDNLVFLQAINPSKPGFITQGNGEWGFATNDGSNTPDVAAIALQFNGAPALLGVPAESGTLTIGANNEIADLWTQRIYARPVVFVSLEDPNLNNGVSIVPTAPITAGNQFLFDVRQTDGFGTDLTGAKVHYLVAEEGWHRLADGRMLLISSAEVKHTGFSGKTIELGASFTDAVTVAQLQRPMLFKNSLGFRQLFDMAVYQGATVTSGVGDFDSIGLRLMQQNGVEATTSDTVYAGRIGFMVLGNLTAIENDFHYVEDTSTNIRGGSYLTVPATNFNNYPHSAATSPLFNKAACAEDDDVQNFCAYLSMPVDMFSRSTFETPRIPYVNANYDPLQMERTLYSEFEGWDWEKVLEADIVHPTVDSSGAAITGALAQMHPNFVADRGWDHVIFGSDSHWHWFALYHYNTCTFDSVHTACTDYLPGEGIIDSDDLQWDASIAYQDLIDYSGWGHLPEVKLPQELFINHDWTLRDSNFFAESLTAPKWASEQTVEYLYQDSLPTEDYSWNSGYYGRNSLFYNAFESGPTAQTWMLHATNLMAYATEFWCSACDGPIPEEVVAFFNLPFGDKGNFETINKAMIKMPSLNSEWDGWRDIGLKLWVKPFVSPLTKRLRDGDYLFANVIWAADATNFRWVRSATGSIDDAVTIATDVFGYQAQQADGNNYVTMCMTYRDIERCGDWHYVGKLPYVTNVHIKTEQGVAAPIVGRALIGNYTYFAPGSGNYDVESHSLYQWQYRVDGQWLDLSGTTAKEQMLTDNIEGGTEVRFCITPRTLENVLGFEVCSPVVTVQADFDGDGIGDNRDNDDDNDGKYDWEDAFPKDASEYLDTDGDGIGNNADTDDDNDGLTDADEITLGSDPLNADTDGDGVVDSIDPRPTVYGDLPDFDNDGIADEVDTDRDNDGVLDFLYAVENKPGLQTSVETGDVVVATFRWDDNPYQACTAHSITVTSNADSGPGTLRQAMADLCASDPYGDLNKISFNGAMTIQLDSPLVITKGMQIDGVGDVVIDGQNASSIFVAAITDRMLNTQYPNLRGLRLRNGVGEQYNATSHLNVESELDMQRQASAVHVRSSAFLIMDHVLIENMTAPAISGKNMQLYLENSLVANVSGTAPALIASNGHIALFSSTIVNSEGGTISLVGEGKAQLRNSLLLKGANGSTVCNVEIWEQLSASWVEDSECGVISSGYVELADPDNGDYRPVPGSANIDAGENGELPPDAVDLLGNARVMGEYNPDYPPELGGPLYPKMDIGAIEYVFNGDFDGDGVPDASDAFPSDPTETVDTDSDGVGDNSDAFPNDANETLDTDSDGIGNNADNDDDDDNVADSEDAFPLDASEWLDSDADGIGNNADTDDDNDNVPDSSDAFPLDATESVDTDLDGIGNNADTDDDNDGVLDASDAFPLDATEAVDTDLDGIGNNADTDDDNDGVLDGADAFPLNPAESMDTDLDGIGNNADTDDDNDGVLDGDDAFPLDATESVDTDFDGIGNNADTDDDNDGVLDGADAFPLNASEWMDTDLDGIGNNADTDDDNDGVLDVADAFPLNTSEWMDSDLDGIGNNADTDDDNDGVLDSDDAFPLDATESVDTDLDGIGNNADTDDDNDGVLDSDDAFPLDASEAVDTDLDGIGNNADTDDDNDGIVDTEDAFPLDAAESVDTDKDGIGNNADTDDDNDGVVDSDDAFPLDAAESVDTDLDGIGNNADTDDDNDGVLDSDDAFPLDASEAVDTDGDGIGNNADPDDDNDGIPDEEDAAPLDPNIGDTQKPVFAELAALTFEATGVMTEITLPEPQVTDNISPTLTISSDLASELALGEHKVVWTATDSAGNSATAEQWVTIVDTTAPEFEELSPLVINASGRLTDISPLLNYSAFDLVDGEVSAAHSGSSELVSGAHELELSATDSSGNTATAMLRLHILPRLKLAKTMTVEAGGSYSVPVQLSGEAPAYPVTMAYSLEVNGVTQPAQSASIASGTSGELMVSIPAGLALNTELLVRVNSISNAFVADDHLTELLLTEQNLAPTISVQVLQQGVPTRVLAPASGEAQIRLSISDVNVNDSHQINWQVLDLAFSGELSADGLTMSINSDELSQGRYAVDVTVTETNTPEQLSSKRRIRFNVAALAELSAATDTDGDGIVDSQEGYGDSDNDGIADYLDNDVDGSRLPVNSTTESMQTSAGVQLSLGNITSALISSGAGLTMTELRSSVAEDAGAADSDDAHFSQVTAVLDFTLSGQIQPGQSVAVVFPLPRGAALPVDAVYRKYNTVQGWFNFVEDSRNSLGSAPLLDGECPAVGAASYEAGLVEGYQCVQLLLEDGGPNDADGNANGVIEDPGVIAVLSQNQLPVANLDTASILDTQTLVIDVLANDSDADGDSLSVIAASADNGAVELLADNTLRFSPGSGFSGTAIIRYQVSDGFGGSAQGEVHVTVSLAPVVEPDTPATDTGGGSMPLWSLLLLGLAFTRYRRAAKPQ